MRVVVDSARTTLDRAGVAPSEVAWFVPHQANIRIIESAASRLGIGGDRTIVNIDHYGNTSAASIPLALAEAAEDGRLQDGDLVLMSGFGAGMTWASAPCNGGNRDGRRTRSWRLARDRPLLRGRARRSRPPCRALLFERRRRRQGHAAVEKAGADTLAVRADIRDPAAVDSALGEIEHALGPVELLVNNAGTTEDGLVARMTDDQWQRAIDTNLTGAFHTIRDAAAK